MPSCNTYRLSWVSLTLGVGYLFTAALAKCSHCSLPWMRGLLTSKPNAECGPCVNFVSGQPTVKDFLGDKGSLAGHGPWGCRQSDTPEMTEQ